LQNFIFNYTIKIFTAATQTKTEMDLCSKGFSRTLYSDAFGIIKAMTHPLKSIHEVKEK
jgi:hypothetical protein